MIGYRYFGFLECNRSDGLRFTWLQIAPGFGIGISLWNHGENDGWTLCLYPIIGKIYLTLPLPRRSPTPYQMGDTWGFHWDWARTGNSFADAIHLNWGQRCKILHMPWTWEWQRSSILMKNGIEWLHDRKMPKLGERRKDWEFREAQREKFAWRETYPYRYVLRSGEVQERTATVEIHEMEWRMRWLQWLPYGALIRRSIDVQFNDEVGERSGSWKGGCTGCGYEIEPGESALDCLRRMERERKF